MHYLVWIPQKHTLRQGSLQVIDLGGNKYIDRTVGKQDTAGKAAKNVCKSVAMGDRGSISLGTLERSTDTPQCYPSQGEGSAFTPCHFCLATAV